MQPLEGFYYFTQVVDHGLELIGHGRSLAKFGCALPWWGGAGRLSTAMRV